MLRENTSSRYENYKALTRHSGGKRRAEWIPVSNVRPIMKKKLITRSKLESFTVILLSRYVLFYNECNAARTKLSADTQWGKCPASSYAVQKSSCPGQGMSDHIFLIPWSTRKVMWPTRTFDLLWFLYLESGHSDRAESITQIGCEKSIYLIWLM